VSSALRRHHAQLLFFAAIIIGCAWFGVITLDDVGVAIATQIGLAGGLVECGDLDSGESRIDIMFGYLLISVQI
jgi:hypothetical protein